MLDQRARALPIPAPARSTVAYKFVSAGYFDVIGIPILRGRSFTAAERDEHPVVIVSESIARVLWPNRDAVGETFRLEPDLRLRTQPRDEPPLPARLVTVVGVSRDVTGFRFTDVKGAGVFLPTSARCAEDHRSWRASAAIPISRGKRCSITSPGSIRTWA